MSDKTEEARISDARKKYLGRPLPRYIRRALESGDEVRVELGIARAIDLGWTEEELVDSFNWFNLYHHAKDKTQESKALAEPAQDIN